MFGIQSIEKCVEHVEPVRIGIPIKSMIAEQGSPVLCRHIGRSSPQRRAPFSPSFSAFRSRPSQLQKRAAGSRLGERCQCPTAWLATCKSRQLTMHEASGARGPSTRVRCTRVVPHEDPAALEEAARQGLLSRDHIARKLGKGGELLPSGSIW